VAWWLNPSQRLRAAGVIVFLGGLAALAMGLGWGRTSLGKGFGFAPRYVTLAAPALCAVYLTWSFCVPATFGRLVQTVMLLLAAAGFVPNMQEGLRWAKERRNAIEAFEHDLRAGVPLSILAENHTRSLQRLDPDDLAGFLRMLHGARVGRFKEMRADPPWRELRLPLTPVATNEVRWQDGAAVGTGNDPYLVFALDRPRFVHAVRWQFSYEKTATPATCEFYWRKSGQPGFADGTRREWAQDAEPGLKRHAVWVNDTIDQFRIDPDNKPCTFRLLELVLLVPADE
jgi:hypothetical protein